MKHKLIITIVALLGLVIASCNTEPAELDMDISISSTDVKAGEALVFTFTGEADFLTFYSGLEGQVYAEYPNAQALNVSLVGGDETFEYIYTNVNTTVTATFVAAAHGNWGEDNKMSQYDFDITVTDSRTGIVSFSVKTGGLFGELFDGVINEDNSTISVNVKPGTPLSAMTTNLITESTIAEVYMNGSPFENKSAVNYSGEDVVFEVKAADGTIQNWTVLITVI